MIAAIVISLPAILHAQQRAPEAIAPLPGIGWQGPPGEVEWEPVEQAGPTDGRRKIMQLLESNTMKPRSAAKNRI